MQQSTLSYGAADIQVLEGLEGVRRRPGMYIGGTDLKGLHQLVYEVVDNSVDEALQGACDTILVMLHSDGKVTVEDNGRGIPVEKHPKVGRSTLEVVMTRTSRRRQVRQARLQGVGRPARGGCICRLRAFVLDSG